MDNNNLLDSNNLYNSAPSPSDPQPQTPQSRLGNSKKWLAGLLLVAVIFSSGYFIGQEKIIVADGKIQVNRAIDRQKADYNLFWEAYETVNSKYVDRPLDQQDLLHGAIAGMVAAAGDPYTVFFDPEEAKQFASELQGTFDGIGAEIGIKENQIVIIAPLQGMPAQKAGLLPGDAVTAINEESTFGMTVDQVVSKIRGPRGTDVKLTIVHEGSQEPREITITRDRIEVKSLTYETKEVNGKLIGVIKLTRFGEDTAGLLSHTVDVILQSGVKGIILDLRSNPGGYLSTAVTTASHWVDSEKIILKERSYQGEVKNFVSEGWPRLKGLKTIVLVNEGSASASEIVAGALQDHGLAIVLGKKTYGKGSVQELVQMKDGSTIKVTIAKWFTPNDRSNDKNGLEPDQEVDRSRDDVLAERDPQMDRALELLR